MILRGGRRDVFLGSRECQGYVQSCVFGEGKSVYDEIPQLNFGLMLHSITYADEAYSKATEGHMSAQFWCPTMRHGVIEFPRPEECPYPPKILREMRIKSFIPNHNYSGLTEFKEVITDGTDATSDGNI